MFYTVGQVLRDIRGWALLVSFILGGVFLSLYLSTTGEEEALFTGIIQCAAIIMCLFFLGAMLMSRENRWIRGLGLFPVGLAFLTALIGLNYYLLEEFDNGNNFIDYLGSGNPMIDGLIITYVPWVLFFAVMGCLYYGITGSETPKRARL